MKDVPEIAPEIRGLLEEIVADPRSAMRLAPKRALRSWFESGETVRAREASATKAERHLIDAHREALAKLLCEASRIAYWKGPQQSLHSCTPVGTPDDPVSQETSWHSTALRKLKTSDGGGEGIELLQECLRGIVPEHGHALALASLALAPGDDARLCLACHASPSRPRWASVILVRTARETRSDRIRGLAWGRAGTVFLGMNRFAEARQAYRMSAQDWSPAWFSLFNLACLAGDKDGALDCSRELDKLASRDSNLVSQVCDLLRRWIATRPAIDAQQARRTIIELEGMLSGTSRRMGLCYG